MIPALYGRMASALLLLAALTTPQLAMAQGDAEPANTGNSSPETITVMFFLVRWLNEWLYEWQIDIVRPTKCRLTGWLNRLCKIKDESSITAI